MRGGGGQRSERDVGGKKGADDGPKSRMRIESKSPTMLLADCEGASDAMAGEGRGGGRERGREGVCEWAGAGSARS